jgi:putative endonuclease
VPADARHGDGRAAEALAALHLRERGLAIVERNVRSRHGEIDLVARDGATLVFVEVRLRRPGRYGGAAASITGAKRTRMIAAAREYLARLPRTPPCRFDVVLLDGLDAARVDWLRDAIDVSGDEGG